MDPQSLDLQGFPEARVEMKVAPFRALTHTRFFSNTFLNNVEMKVASFRALTHCMNLSSKPLLLCRNEGRPIQGIDTSFIVALVFDIQPVEMKVAPFRALILI